MNGSGYCPEFELDTLEQISNDDICEGGSMYNWMQRVEVSFCSWNVSWRTVLFMFSRRLVATERAGERSGGTVKVPLYVAFFSP